MKATIIATIVLSLVFITLIGTGLYILFKEIPGEDQVSEDIKKRMNKEQ